MSKLEEFLLNEFSDVYCYNCKFESISVKEAEEKYGYWGCDDCHRKYIGWELSEEEAKRIAKEILEVIKDE